MSRQRSYSPMTCQNPTCDYFLIEEGKDLVKNGRNSAGNQQYFCKHCRTYFIETKNTPLYYSHLEQKQVELIGRLSQEKISMRGASRVTGHHPATVARYYRLIGEHANLLTSSFLQDLGPERIEMDEFWAFIQKNYTMPTGPQAYRMKRSWAIFIRKNKHCEGLKDRYRGDWWTYTAVRSATGLMIAHHAGKRTDATCAQFNFLVFSRLKVPEQPTRISIMTDGNPQYLTALTKQCKEIDIDYGRVIKQHEANRLVAVIREKVLGNPTLASISTSVVEGYNNKIRQRISRFVRKTASFSKTIMGHVRAMDRILFANNFFDVKEGVTPAMQEGITDRVWTWPEFLTYHYQL